MTYTIDDISIGNLIDFTGKRFYLLSHFLNKKMREFKTSIIESEMKNQGRHFGSVFQVWGEIFFYCSLISILLLIYYILFNYVIRNAI